MSTEQTPATAPVDAVVSVRCCETCCWIDRFTPREDELKRGFVIGCKKPGYEGYSSPLRMACDGVFWQPAKTCSVCGFPGMETEKCDKCAGTVAR